MKYKILTIVTLILPMVSFILISTITNQTYDAEIYLYEESSVIDFNVEDNTFYVSSENASYSGYIVPYNEDYAVLIEENEIVKIEREYYTPYFDTETQEYQLTNIKDIPPTPQKTNNWVISVASLVAIGLVALIIGGKMDVLKKHPRASAFVTLLVITLILWGLNSIISDMLYVFIVATGSWGGYCIEYLVHKGTISKADGDKAQSTLKQALKEALNE